MYVFKYGSHIVLPAMRACKPYAFLFFLRGIAGQCFFDRILVFGQACAEVNMIPEKFHGCCSGCNYGLTQGQVFVNFPWVVAIGNFV